MEWYSDIQILFATHRAQCNAWVDKHFEGYGVLNYCHSGALHWEMKSVPARKINGPVAWITWPGPQWRFGLRPDEGHWDHRCVGFSGPRLTHFIERGLMPTERRPPLFHPIAPERFRARFDVLIKRHASAPPNGDPRVAHSLEGLLLELHRDAERTVPRETHIEALVQSIIEHPALDWDFQKEANRLNHSLVHFRRRFKQTTGHPPHQFMLNARLNQAAELLRDTTRPIKDIAAHVGMPDIYHFSRQFKQKFHLPPGRYRQEAMPL